MNESTGIIVVHGYCGQPDDLEAVRRELVERFGAPSVSVPFLPGHGKDSVPRFDAIRFGRCIDEAVEAALARHRRLILIGHSTGGNLLIDHIARRRTVPALLILVATPCRINGSDLHRWEAHRRDAPDISLTSTARLVSHINRTGAMRIPAAFPVLVIQGEADPLVRPAQADGWTDARFGGPVSCEMIPHAGHNPFTGPASATALIAVCRATEDAMRCPPSGARLADTLCSIDAEAAAFITARPGRVRHLLDSPSARRALDRPLHFPPVVKTDPVRLNVEITTRCNLACSHCARRFLRRPEADMDPALFGDLLDRLPNTFKVTLVGLGEPTLHPALASMVGSAADRGHRVGLVTNAMTLDRSLCRELVTAGLGSLAVSLDSDDPQVAARVRAGSDLARIIGNVDTFRQIAGDAVTTAVFTAVSTVTVHSLPTLADTVAGLNVDAWMLSDLNFDRNRSKTLWKNGGRTGWEAIAEAIRRAFSHGLPVLSVRGLEALGLSRRYADYLIRTPAALAERSVTHHGCYSPWQTLPVDVNGHAAVCDCQPAKAIGNLLKTPFEAVWNGSVMQDQRYRMRTTSPPAACRGCPRF